MTKEHAYAYEAGYVDGSTHYELEHCPACKNVADLQEALEENAKLREERDHWHVEQVHAFGNWEDAHKHATELEAENARLRRLARLMARALGFTSWADPDWCFVECQREFGCRTGDDAEYQCPLVAELRELEIEVN